MTRFRLVLMLLSVLALAVFAGCGSSDDSGSTRPRRKTDPGPAVVALRQSVFALPASASCILRNCSIQGPQSCGPESKRFLRLASTAPQARSKYA